MSLFLKTIGPIVIKIIMLIGKWLKSSN